MDVKISNPQAFGGGINALSKIIGPGPTSIIADGEMVVVHIEGIYEGQLSLFDETVLRPGRVVVEFDDVRRFLENDIVKSLSYEGGRFLIIGEKGAEIIRTIPGRNASYCRRLSKQLRLEKNDISSMHKLLRQSAVSGWCDIDEFAYITAGVDSRGTSELHCCTPNLFAKVRDSEGSSSESLSIPLKVAKAISSDPDLFYDNGNCFDLSFGGVMVRLPKRDSATFSKNILSSSPMGTFDSKILSKTLKLVAQDIVEDSVWISLGADGLHVGNGLELDVRVDALVNLETVQVPCSFAMFKNSLTFIGDGISDIYIREEHISLKKENRSIVISSLAQKG